MSHGTLDLDKLRVVQERLDSSRQSDDYTFYKIDVGSHYFRILPPWDESNMIAMEVYKHFNCPTSDSTDTEILTCVQKTFPSSKVSCPICDVIREIEDKVQGVEMKRFKASYKAYVNAVFRKKMDASGSLVQTPDLDDETVYIVPLSNTVYSAIGSYCLDPDVGDITKPDHGFDVKVTRTGTGFTDTRYAVMLMPGSGPISKDSEIQQQILDSLPKLSDIWKFPDEEEMAGIRKSAGVLASNFSVAPTTPAYHDPAMYEQPKVEELPTTEELEEGMPELAEPAETPVTVTPANMAEVAADEAVPETDASVTEKVTKPMTVTTPDDVVRMLEIQPLTHKKALDGLNAGTPQCYGQWTVVAEEYAEICDKRCAYELACRAAEKEIKGNA